MNQSAQTELTPFTTLLSGLNPSGDQFTTNLPDDWLQGRTAYGGLSASICLAATLAKFDELPPLRSAQFSFVGPATGQLLISPTVLRKGKSTVFAGADVQGEAGLAVRATLCFGVERSCAHTHGSLPMPDVPAPDQCQDYYTWTNRPNFMHHFEGKLASGARPGASNNPPEMTVWLRHRDTETPSSMTSLLALADALPPAAMVLYEQVIPISTMTWAVDVLASNPFSSNGWWLVRASANTSEQGYSAQETVIWNPDGQPVLLARQNVAIFG